MDRCRQSACRFVRQTALYCFYSLECVWVEGLKRLDSDDVDAIHLLTDQAQAEFQTIQKSPDMANRSKAAAKARVKKVSEPMHVEVRGFIFGKKRVDSLSYE